MIANKLIRTFLSAFVIVLIFVLKPPFAESLLLEEIEVKAKKEAGVESLEVREVRETDAKDTGEALEVIDGVSKVRKGGIANDIVLRGFQRDNINVLVDGVRVYGACPNRMDPPSFHLDFAEVDRIDVLKGPFDVKNQGSMAGLVDIKTKSAKKGFHGEINLNYGSFESINSSVTASYGGERADILAGIAYKYSKPYEDGDGVRFTDIYPLTSPNRYRDSERDGSAYNIKTGWAKLGFNPLKDHRIELSVTRQEADDVLYPYLLMDANYDDTSRLNLIYKIDNIGKTLKGLKLQAYWNKVKHDMTDEKRCSSTMDPSLCSDDLPRPYSMRTYAETETWGGKIEGQFGFIGETTIGIDYYLRNWDNVTTMAMKQGMMYMYMDQASVPDVDVKNIGLYIEQKNKLTERLNLTAGVRLDSTETEAGIDRTELYNLYYPSSDRSKTDTYLSGNIQLGYDLTKSLNAFLGLGHSVRVPDPIERYFALKRMGDMMKPDWMGNPSLKPVKNNEADMGLKYSTGSALLKLNLFYSDLTDFIVVRSLFNGSRYAKTYKNIDATMYGGEVSARISLPSDFYLTGGLSYTRGKNDSEDTDLPEIPPLKGRLSLRYDNNTYFGEIEGVFTATQDKIDTLLKEKDTSGWAIANLKVGYIYKRFKFFAGIRNIFDKRYYEHLSYSREPFASGISVPEPGRTLYANLQYVF
ncbi:MAG: TonB-dependent receptor [Thermodesulfovibrionales bacterium]